MTREKYLEVRDKLNSIESRLERMAFYESLSAEDKEDYFYFDKCDSENEEIGELKYYDCPICKNKGHISCFKREDGKITEFVKPCECEPKRKMFKNLYECGIGLDLFKEYTFDKFSVNFEWQQRVKDLVLDYLNKDNAWFVISGVSGCGKTHLCTAIVGKLLKQGNEIKYMAWKDEIVNLKANKRSSYEDSQEKFERDIQYLKTVDVLYIDDFLKNMGNYDKSSDLDLAYQIINGRYLNKKKTIISTELSKLEINALDSAVCGRLSQMAGEYWVQLGNDCSRNYRMREFNE